MSNIARLNKNSIISLSTNDNTSSLKVNKRMDEADLKRIQRRLADKVSTNNKRKPIKKYKDVRELSFQKGNFFLENKSQELVKQKYS